MTKSMPCWNSIDNEYHHPISIILLFYNNSYSNKLAVNINCWNYTQPYCICNGVISYCVFNIIGYFIFHFHTTPTKKITNITKWLCTSDFLLDMIRTSEFVEAYIQQLLVANAISEYQTLIWHETWDRALI